MPRNPHNVENRPTGHRSRDSLLPHLAPLKKEPGQGSLKALNDHILRLCKEHRIKLTFHARGKEHDAAYFDNSIRVRFITSKARYAVALHEIGHLVTRTRSSPRLIQEGAAWGWARTHALCWTKSMQTAMLVGLRSYLEAFLADYAQALPGQLRAPPRGHPFWELLKDDPRVQKLLAKRAPHWLNPSLVSVPWGTLLSHPERPKCANCAYWRHLLDHRGECFNSKRPLGMEITPKDALCGTAWVRNL